MMRIFYDTEFLEAGPAQPVRLISIGMAREDGAEYYAVSDEATRRPLNGLIRRNAWLMSNVVPALPRAHGDWNLQMPKRWLFNYSDPCVRPRHVIAREVRDFILAAPEPELWADWGAYDHVALCQLFGRMTDLPDGIPMWTHDLRQEIERLGAPDPPHLTVTQAGGREHNALHDAREVRYRHGWLTARAA
jgi:3' exoribonuclease, RNase T-like